MFKFLKEVQKSFIEGLEEGKQEFQEEQQLKKKSSNQILEALHLIPKEERFGTSLAAPFRTTAFNDWFTMFKNIRESKEEDVLPLHLYKYGNLNDLKEEEIAMLKKQQEGSFPIVDEEDVLSIVQSFLLGIEISLKTLDKVDPKYQPKELICYRDGKLLPTWSLSAAASTLISGVELNGVSKEYSLKIFSELLPIIQEKYTNWNDFGQKYKEEDSLLNSNKKDIKRTENTIHNLTFKFGSPWGQFKLEDY